MKTSAILPSFTLALAAAAEPTKVSRDTTAVTSAVAQISDAIGQLDTSVQGFTNDATQVQADAKNLISTMKSAVSSISDMGEISMVDAAGLEEPVKSLGAAGQTLLDNLLSKKGAFQSADLCSTAQGLVQDVSDETQSLVKSVIDMMPQEIQQQAQQASGELTQIMSKGTTAFGADQCKAAAAAASGPASAFAPSAAAPSAPAGGAVPPMPMGSAFPMPFNPVARQAAPQTVTVTVTAPCSGAAVSSAPPASAPATTPATTPYPIVSSASVTPSQGMNSTYAPTGAYSTSSFPPIATAGAATYGAGSAGVLAGLAAALFL
ncbi:hydrophobic surface binding protein A-domain-containing protein [Xylariaceae sp. FL0662B]|nr:hydrophobic surface binding protein A-domain-containing protein [Xylariaceae sp. FL0662B]